MNNNVSVLALFGVYAIVNDETGEVYVGQTSGSFLKRWSQHIDALEAGKHTCKPLQQAFNERGIEAFTFTILEVLAQINSGWFVEQSWIDRFEEHTGCYNRLKRSRYPYTRG